MAYSKAMQKLFAKVERAGRKNKSPTTSAPKVGDVVVPRDDLELTSGVSRYSEAIVLVADPFVLSSRDGDMPWGRVKPAEVRVIGRVSSRERESIERKQGLTGDWRDRMRPDTKSARSHSKVLAMALDAIEEIERKSGLQQYRHRQLLSDLRVAARRLQSGESFGDAWGRHLDEHQGRIAELALAARRRRGEED